MNKAKSGGIIRGRPLDKMQVAVAKKMGFDINSKPKGLTSEMLIWHDLAVIVADDDRDPERMIRRVIPEMFNGCHNGNKGSPDGMRFVFGGYYDGQDGCVGCVGVRYHFVS